MATYTAKDLNEIAKHFDELAAIDMKRQLSAKPVECGKLAASSRTWQAAAEFLRNTQLVPDSPPSQ